MAARLFASLAFLAFASDVLAIDPGRVAVGDKVFVAVDGTEFHAQGKVDSLLPRMTEMHVLEISGAWVGGAVTIDRQQKKGWIQLRKLFKPDDRKIALDQSKLGVAKDFLGNILEVDASKAKITGADLVSLRRLYSLESLNLSATAIGDDDLKQLRGLTNLRRVYLDKTAITDTGLGYLNSLPRLEVLTLRHTRVTGPGLARLDALKDLLVLNLSACKIGDDDLRRLARFKSLGVLALDGVAINGAGLIHLKELTKLNLLNLNGCRLQRRAILNLNGLHDLRALYLDHSVIDEVRERELNRLLPRLAIIKRESE